jgi:hypothetical protein
MKRVGIIAALFLATTGFAETNNTKAIRSHEQRIGMLEISMQHLFTQMQGSHVAQQAQPAQPAQPVQPLPPLRVHCLLVWDDGVFTGSGETVTQAKGAALKACSDHYVAKKQKDVFAAPFRITEMCKIKDLVCDEHKV